MVIQFGVKEHIKMAETYRWAEEELVKYLKLQNELIDDSKRYWNGETADAFRRDYEYMLQEGEYAAFMKYVHGMKEVMEESIPRFRLLQQMVVELPTAYGLPCDEEAPEILRLDEESVAKYHELSDEIIAKNRHFCDEMIRIMDGCEGLVDFSEEKRELEELREEMHQMEVFKRKLDEYADEMRRMDNWMVERLSEFVIKTDGNPNKALFGAPTVNENCVRMEEKQKDNKNVEPHNHRQEEIETMTRQENGVLFAGVAEVLERDIDGISSVLEYQNKLEVGEEILTSYLIEAGIIGSSEQEKICNAVRNFRPRMLIKLYNADCNGTENVGESAEEVFGEIMDYYDSYYFGKYSYPAAYIEGIIMGYETHAIQNNRFVLDDDKETIAYGHEVKDGEDFENGLGMEEGLELAISDLDEKYDGIITCISEINEINGMEISINDFTENQIIFLVDFSYNRGKGLVKRPKEDENGNSLVHTSLAILILAVWEEDYETIIYTLKEETKNQLGEYYTGLELRRMDEYEILINGDYKRDYDIERECNGWVEGIYRP